MFGNEVLDVFIGLVFIYLLYSLLATIVQEVIATKLAFRAKVLEKAIIRMLEDGKSITGKKWLDRLSGLANMFLKPNLLMDKKVAAWFYAHPLVKYLGEDNYYSKPAYLSAQNFSKIMIDLLKGFGDSGKSDIQQINDSIANGTIFHLPINVNSDRDHPAVHALSMQLTELTSGAKLKPDDHIIIDPNQTEQLNMDTKLFLQSLWKESATDLEKFKAKLEQWYDDTMDRASGWYKRYIQYILFVIGLLIAFIFNVDSVSIYKILAKDKTAREQIVQMAVAYKTKAQTNINLVAQEKQKPDSATKSDTLLNKAFKSVSADAEKANQVMGLGKPWLDTCDMVADQTFKAYQSTLIDSLKSGSTTHCDSFLKIKTKNDYIIKRANIIQGDGIHNWWRNRVRFRLGPDQSLFKFGPNQTGGWETLFGWVLTAMALSLGAPFWFDLLNKLMQLRGGPKIDTANSTAADLPASKLITGNYPSSQQSTDVEAVG